MEERDNTVLLLLQAEKNKSAEIKNGVLTVRLRQFRPLLQCQGRDQPAGEDLKLMGVFSQAYSLAV